MLARNRNPERLGQQLAEAAAHSGDYPLLVLPSTDKAFRLVQAYRNAGMRIGAVGNAGLVASWGITFEETFLWTPLKVWASLKDCPKLPWAVVVFEDQLVAIDDSYLRVEVDGHAYMVSPIVMMILMKFRPPSYLGSMSTPIRRRESEIRLVPYAVEIPMALTQSHANEVMGQVLRPLIDLGNAERIPWLARTGFALKRDYNFHRVLVQQVQEMESLVRLYSAQPSAPTLPAGWLDVLRASRIEMVKQLL